MTKAMRVHQVGGPEAMVYEDVDVPAPGPGEVRIRQHAVGLNFIDVYYRTGLYKAPSLPFTPGNEASGEVLAVGPGVTNFHPGDRVLVHAAAGGIGLLACQWAKALGAHVIGTVGSKAKADLALANGCD